MLGSRQRNFSMASPSIHNWNTRHFTTKYSVEYCFIVWFAITLCMLTNLSFYFVRLQCIPSTHTNIEKEASVKIHYYNCQVTSSVTAMHSMQVFFICYLPIILDDTDIREFIHFFLIQSGQNIYTASDFSVHFGRTQMHPFVEIACLMDLRALFHRI